MDRRKNHRLIYLEKNRGKSNFNIPSLFSTLIYHIDMRKINGVKACHKPAVFIFARSGDQTHRWSAHCEGYPHCRRLSHGHGYTQRVQIEPM